MAGNLPGLAGHITRFFGKRHKFWRENLPRFCGNSPEVGPEISRGLERNIARFGRKSHKVGREISHVLAGNLTRFGGKSHLFGLSLPNFHKIWRDLHEISPELGCHLTRFIPKSPEVRGRQEVYFLHFWGVVCLIQRALRF